MLEDGWLLDVFPLEHVRLCVLVPLVELFDIEILALTFELPSLFDLHLD